MPSSLPPSFTSLYRLFLRSTSTAVLHHKLARRNLRNLWRPVFVDAAKVSKQLQDPATSLSTRNDLQAWLDVWQRRMDNVLALLYSSSVSRGLPHQVMRNLNLLVYTEHARASYKRLPVWKPQLAPDAPEYRISPPSIKQMNKEERERRFKYFEDIARNTLGQVVKMAEGRDQIHLGRVRMKGTVFQK
ncbi:hypothetical protein K435DRAFT_644864 [Dendrothele bispora CBS 962.96]|uniref:Uncharacterized protein n=1 Tax=Dendrothele bispora (strain CBS 962.96) TaxID=1314807 RepID=A0A4S8MU83_DENBC|nr:hypothetical protein K435DRAFT_644864 [Dendrothele bispora CBS 962.96]